jgi:hypothetical protein
MFNCEQCSSVFTLKRNLLEHQKKHNCVIYPCTLCKSTFNDKSNINRHMKNIHGEYLLFYIHDIYLIYNLFYLQRNRQCSRKPQTERRIQDRIRRPTRSSNQYTDSASNFCSKYFGWYIKCEIHQFSV